MGKPPFILDEKSEARLSGGMGRRGRLASGEVAAPYSHGQTMEAWASFLTAEEQYRSSRSAVRSVIEQSWQRSLKSGVNARGNGSTRIMPQSELERLRIENDDLLGSARRTFQRIADTLGDAATMAVITDSRGIILDVGGDRKTIEDAHDIRLEIGAAWNESITGTNGIGTALATGQLTHVHAAEHFCEGVKSWSCVGAPIHSPVDGSVIGIVDFSGPQEIFHRHNLALALISANHIELALVEKIRTERMQLLEASLRRVPRVGPSDGIVVVDRFGRVIHHNETASLNLRTVINLAGSLANGQRILDLKGTIPDGDLETSLPEELREYSVLPLVVGGTVRGAMLVIGSKTRSATPVPAAPAIFKSVVPEARQQIVGRSPVLLEAIEKAERAASGRASILLEGETGVGKALFARLIHAASFPIGDSPFVVIDGGTTPTEMNDTEFFGRAPTFLPDAKHEERSGYFAAAEGGTLVIAKIEELSIDLQGRLLRSLEEPTVRRVSEGKPCPSRVRLVSTATRSLRADISAKTFRKDLYFRVAATKIVIPPLRERLGDVEDLVDHFNRFFAERYDVNKLRFEAETLQKLHSYAWPGNVLELRNMVENVMLMAPGRAVTPDDLPHDLRDAIDQTASPASLRTSLSRGTSEATTLDFSERLMIERAVHAAGGNISAAAEKLGVSRSTVYRKLDQYRSSS